ncbi:uncharacterized protein PV09_07239 [Verruconis gallopava]|uniref:Lysophospholipase n=1 Tax=Verruconis gallopava TaxID=253628 RepID=A0A0D2A3Z5_9PEZI|nr:uncharacterized protein PV09_07239 [Verruconis gallopava]KIW01190.1 hypothetical protein PV09_07239 [Verruconis gallopava]
MAIDPQEVHPDDVPTIALGGSGGGLRAMITVLGFCNESKKAKLWDTFTYVAGTSGSCWSLAAYYTFGEASMSKVIEHCKHRLHPHHPFSYHAIRELLTKGAYATLGPLIQKRKSGLNTVAMDFYSVLTTGYLFLHKDPALTPGGPGLDTKKEVAGYHSEWFKWSNALLQDGKQPLPILTAVRHERPWITSGVMQDSWFQWFEMTPFEVGCDELQAWVPTWGFGRPFYGGKSQTQLPEQSLALLLGLCTSAPAAHLKSYVDVIERNLSSGFFGNLIRAIARRVTTFWGEQGMRIFQMHHPIHACNEHNFLFRLNANDKSKSETDADLSIAQFPRLHLIDAGVDNNCPTYVLLHPSRKVDVIITVDASSDVRRNLFQTNINRIGSRRKLQFCKRSSPKKDGSTNESGCLKDMYAQIYDGTIMEHRPETVVDLYGNVIVNPPAPPSKKDCTMIYVPLLPNENAVKGFDPLTAKFARSFNLIWTPEQVESLTQVAAANFREGEETIKAVLLETWLKKKAMRESRGDSLSTTQKINEAVR